MIEDALRDLSHGARVLRKNPGFAAVVLATLTLGIGATVTVFSIVDAWLLRPLNFPDADRLVIGLAATRERPSEPAVFMLYRTYLGWKERSRSFEVLSAAFRRAYLITGRGDAATVVGMAVTEDFFRTLGVAPALGRTFAARDIGGPSAAVLSHGVWERQFGASNAVLGTHVALNGALHEIIGVMPREFDVRMLEQARGSELWTLLQPGEPGYTPGGTGPVAIIGRLSDAVTVSAAQAELAAIQQDIEAAYTDNFERFVVHLARLQDDNTRTVRATLLTVAGAVGGMLLIACMNVGALLVGRGLGRAREAAIRSAVGCSRARLVRQFLTETLLLSLCGGICGLVVAFIATRLFASWNPLGTLPPGPIQINWRVLVFAAAVTSFAAIVCGLVPAVRVAATDPNDALRSRGDPGWTGARRSERAQGLLLVGQVAVSVVLLVGTTLLVRTFVRLHNEPLGFDAAGLTVVSLALPADEVDSSEERNAFYRQLADRVASLPGVRRVAAGTSPPLSSGAVVPVRTSADDSVDPLRISAQDVTAEFFETVGIPLVAGRAFDGRDLLTSLPVAVVNENAARMLFGSPADALGRRIRIGTQPWREIVGIVRNTRSAFYNTLEWQMNPIVYLPSSQSFAAVRDPTIRSFGLHLHVRAARPLSMTEVRNQVRSVSSRVAVTELRAASEAIVEATRQPAFRMALVGWFGAASLLLAAIGVYGLVAQGVLRRTREIGIRLALGADGGDVIRSVTRRALTVAIAGAACGTAAAFVLARTLRTLLYGVQASDVASFVTATAALLAVTGIAAFVPAFRATRIDPVTVLKAD